MRFLPVAVALLLPLGCLHSQSSKDRLVVDDERVRTIADRCLPAVERACGRTFRQSPNVVLADTGDVMRALRRELEPSVAQFFAGQPRARIERALQLRADMFSGALLGKYVFDSKELYVLPHLVAVQLATVDRSDADHDQVLQLVIAHELVHALQDQELGLRAMAQRCPANDAVAAMTMLIEGHAVFCSERAAAELGLTAAIEPLRGVIAGVRDSTQVQRSDLSGRRLRGQNVLIYLRSAAFFASEYARGGHDRLWQLLATPLPTTRLMLEGQDLPPRANLASIFGDIDQDLAGRNWTTGSSDLSGLLVRGENMTALADLEPLLASWQAGGEWFAVAPTPLAWRSLLALSFATDKAAIGFHELAERVARDDAKFGGSDAGESEQGWIDLPGVSTSRVRQELRPGSAVGHRVQIVWLRRGRHVLQFTCQNAALEGAVLASVAMRLFTRLGD